SLATWPSGRSAAWARPRPPCGSEPGPEPVSGRVTERRVPTMMEPDPMPKPSDPMPKPSDPMPKPLRTHRLGPLPKPGWRANAHAEGFEFRGTVRSWDNKYYSKAAVVSPPGLRAPYHNDEFGHLSGFARALLKVPVTGAYTLADWSYDELYDTDTPLLAPLAE